MDEEEEEEVEEEEEAEEKSAPRSKKAKAPPTESANSKWAEAAETFKDLGKMLRMRERDSLYGESRESREYFQKEHERQIAKGFPIPVKKCVEVCGTQEDFVSHSVPGGE